MVMGVFGGGINFVSFVINKIGSLKVSDNNYCILKILILLGKKLFVNYRNIVSVCYLWENYLNEKSFV